MKETTVSAAALVLARHPHPSVPALATALGHAFLAADQWTARELIASAARTLGARHRWVGPLVAEVLAAYHRPPIDAPRELASMIEAAEAFRAAVARAEQRRAPIRIAHYAVEPGTARPMPAGVPRINGHGALAELLGLSPGELDWFADTALWNRRGTSERLQHYRYEWRQREGRVPRLLEVPQRRLKGVQRSVLASILGPIPAHDAAHGFVPGRSAVSGAALHTGNDVLIALDLSTFFARVPARRIFGTLRQAGLPEAVAHTVSGLCTHAVPPRVIAAMPRGGTAEDRFALRRALATPHLPQGAPTSPALANLAIHRLDARLSGWADAAGATYTRYADDLAFSGGPPLARRADAFVRGVTRIVEAEGHSLNRLKTRVRASSVRQVVTGIVVNDRTNLPRAEFDRLKAVLHNCVMHGPHSQNRAGHSDFRAHLLGRISWVEALNPGRGPRLREELERIRW
ncbi:reverse transcriptase family protein [Marisediminicola antarctica]|uniref:reverse transcriptase family protein n=1 Tax=Marisediminicola antarctica TaxID=674079 RepID=UPI00192A5596|nr:reverse transcriptase family protein [Marisediminicola antarctica]